MGFFSFVGKALGKVAKAGLSAATHGASDKVLSLFKSRGNKPGPTKPTVNASMQNQALLAKIGAPVPKLSRTESGSSMPTSSGAGSTGKRKRKASTGAKRSTPKGGLDLAAIGKLYQAAGKPGGDWRGFVKAHSDMRKG